MRPARTPQSGRRRSGLPEEGDRSSSRSSSIRQGRRLRPARRSFSRPARSGRRRRSGSRIAWRRRSSSSSNRGSRFRRQPAAIRGQRSSRRRRCRRSPQSQAARSSSARRFRFRAMLTLRARHDPKAKTVVLSGRLTALGQPEANVRIACLHVRRVELSGRRSSRTNAAGEYQLKRRVTRDDGVHRLRRGGSEALYRAVGGARRMHERDGHTAVSGDRVVVVREATDPKLVVRARDRALARRAGLKIGDFPEGWEVRAADCPDRRSAPSSTPISPR